MQIEIPIETSPATIEEKSDLGQYLTSARLASFIASLLPVTTQRIRLLDPGAGEGALTRAFVNNVLTSATKPSGIDIVAIELDPRLHPALEANLYQAKNLLRKKHIETTVQIIQGDFISLACQVLQFRTANCPALSRSFTHIIQNPPYKKIQSNSETRRQLSEIGIETSNLYSAFVWISALMLQPEGHIAAITPRSFCNGPYFRLFRVAINRSLTWKRIHVIDQRGKAFQTDGVLQENIVYLLQNSRAKTTVIVSSIDAVTLDTRVQQEVQAQDLVQETDADQFIHLPTEENAEHVKLIMSKFTASLASLNLKVSTGRVVDFRAKEHLCVEPEEDTVPLIYPMNFSGFSVLPRAIGSSKKPSAIRLSAKTESLMVPAGTYVLVKRFTSKEEKRRIVASILKSSNFPGADFYGIENHINYFHNSGKPLDQEMAQGLAMFLNSTVVDDYFRQFNGHTQVNATDLRRLGYPTKEQLKELGRQKIASNPTQEYLDKALESLLS